MNAQTLSALLIPGSLFQVGTMMLTVAEVSPAGPGTTAATKGRCIAIIIATSDDGQTHLVDVSRDGKMTIIASE